MITGKISIEFIQGDYYQKNVLIENVELALIEGVYISCNKLNISQKLDYDNDIQRFKFVLTSEETAIMDPIITDYDLTIKFTSDKIKTLAYRGTLSILPKTNKVGGINDD